MRTSSSGCSFDRQLPKSRRLPVPGVNLQCQIELLQRRGVVARMVEHISEEKVSVAVCGVALHMGMERCQMPIEVGRLTVQIARIHRIVTRARTTVHPTAYRIRSILVIPDRILGNPEVKLRHAVLRRRQNSPLERLYGERILFLFEITLPSSQAVVSPLLSVTAGPV